MRCYDILRVLISGGEEVDAVSLITDASDGCRSLLFLELIHPANSKEHTRLASIITLQ